MRNRIIGHRIVRAGDLKPDPRNWRDHPEYQKSAIKSMLDEIGQVASLIARETEGGLMLVDGHLRASLDPDQEVSVTIVDLDDDEAAAILATLDAIGDMAEANAEKLAELMKVSDITDEGLVSHLEDLIDSSTWKPDAEIAEDEIAEDDSTQTIRVTCGAEIGKDVLDAICDAVARFEDVRVS